MCDVLYCLMILCVGCDVMIECVCGVCGDGVVWVNS